MNFVYILIKKIPVFYIKKSDANTHELFFFSDSLS